MGKEESGPRHSEEDMSTCLAQSEEANEEILSGIFVGQECFPATVCSIVSSNELHLLSPNLGEGG